MRCLFSNKCFTQHIVNTATVKQNKTNKQTNKQTQFRNTRNEKAVTQLNCNVISIRFYFLLHFQENKYVKTPMHTYGKRITNFVSRTFISLYLKKGKHYNLLFPRNSDKNISWYLMYR